MNFILLFHLKSNSLGKSPEDMFTSARSWTSWLWLSSYPRRFTIFILEHLIFLLTIEWVQNTINMCAMNNPLCGLHFWPRGGLRNPQLVGALKRKISSHLGVTRVHSCFLHDVEPKSHVTWMLLSDWSCAKPTPFTTHTHHLHRFEIHQPFMLQKREKNWPIYINGLCFMTTKLIHIPKFN